MGVPLCVPRTTETRTPKGQDRYARTPLGVMLSIGLARRGDSLSQNAA